MLLFFSRFAVITGEKIITVKMSLDIFSRVSEDMWHSGMSAVALNSSNFPASVKTKLSSCQLNFQLSSGCKPARIFFFFFKLLYSYGEKF